MRWVREGERGGRRGREEKRRGEECYIQFYRGGKPITRRYTRNTSHPTFRIVIKKEKGENREKKRMGEGKAEGWKRN